MYHFDNLDSTRSIPVLILALLSDGVEVDLKSVCISTRMNGCTAAN